MKLSEAEWAVMDVLWSGERFTLGEVTHRLEKIKGWSRNTVHTYLTKMENKGLVSIDHSQPKPYAAAVDRERCARRERDELLTKVYGGAAVELVAAFLKESSISPQEVQRLRQLLDQMEV